MPESKQSFIELDSEELEQFCQRRRRNRKKVEQDFKKISHQD